MRETSGVTPSPRQPPKDYKEDAATKRAREKASQQLKQIDSATTPEALERARISLKVQELRKLPTHQEVGEEIHTGRKLAEMMITEIKAKETPKTPQEQLIVKQIEELNLKIAANYAPAGGTRIFKKG
ncbi:MAG: hypothetical protein JSR80_05195 [Verrucomicrobia bacterium]|nr:hypothetical protein [Verrucomicrobiota bacterium]